MMYHTKFHSFYIVFYIYFIYIVGLNDLTVKYSVLYTTSKSDNGIDKPNNEQNHLRFKVIQTEKPMTIADLKQNHII